ncbi:MAG: hypothetical protein Q9M89_09280 [Persephonella sp.]|nr:hypothetical protein [Persephonella sp.]
MEIDSKELFIKNIIDFFDKRATGYFRADNSKDTYDKLREIVDEIDFNNKEDIKNFLSRFIEKLEENNNFPIKQIKGKSGEEKKKNLLKVFIIFFFQ